MIRIVYGFTAEQGIRLAALSVVVSVCVFVSVCVSCFYLCVNVSHPFLVSIRHFIHSGLHIRLIFIYSL